MCEQCLAETKMYNDEKEVLPGFFLVRATKDGQFMKTGDWGLVMGNNPSFLFSSTPEKEPFVVDENNNDITDLKIWEEWLGKVKLFDFNLNQTNNNLKDSYLLVKSCYEAGYKDNDGYVGYWLFSYLSQFV